VPVEAREQLLGEDALAAGCFVLALLATISLLHCLAAVALGDTSRRQLRMAIVLLAFTVVSMVGAQQRIRRELQDRLPPAKELGARDVGGTAPSRCPKAYAHAPRAA
jgi:hypothetical protein